MCYTCVPIPPTACCHKTACVIAYPELCAGYVLTTNISLLQNKLNRFNTIEGPSLSAIDVLPMQ